MVCISRPIVIEDDVFIGPNVTFTNDVLPRSRQGNSRDFIEQPKTLIKAGASIGGVDYIAWHNNWRGSYGWSGFYCGERCKAKFINLRPVCDREKSVEVEKLKAPFRPVYAKKNKT